MKKQKGGIFLRYEFSDETGNPEGGDVFEFSSPREFQSMLGQILKVAHADGVAVNLTIGEETPFFGYMKNGGLSREDISREMVSKEELMAGAGTKKKATKKAATKKVAKKSVAKKSKK